MTYCDDIRGKRHNSGEDTSPISQDDGVLPECPGLLLRTPGEGHGEPGVRRTRAPDVNHGRGAPK